MDQLIPRRPFVAHKQEIYTPKSMCFVTAAGSDQPYLDLAIQLIESIRNTPYKKIPICILDCGLSNKDKKFFESQGHITVKKTKWSVDLEYLKFNDRSSSTKEGWKGATERPFIHEHFPGYELYFWIDTDCWVQDPSALSDFIKEAEKTGIGCTRESAYFQYWKSHFWWNHFALHTLPDEAQLLLSSRQAIINNAYCIRKDFAKKYASDARILMDQLKEYRWGFDLASLNYSIYKHIENPNVLQENHYNYADVWPYGFPVVDQDDFLYSPNSHKALGVCMLPKYLPRQLPMLTKESSILKNFFVTLCIYAHRNISKIWNIDSEKFYRRLSVIVGGCLATLHFRIPSHPKR